MAKAQNATTVSAHVPNDYLAKIDEIRGDMSRSYFLGLMCTRWYMDGCPQFDGYAQQFLAFALKTGRAPEIHGKNMYAAPIDREEPHAAEDPRDNLQPHDEDRPA